MPATSKAKLMRQMLAQKERGFVQVPCDQEEWWTPVSKTLFLLKPEVIIGVGRGELFFILNYLSSFWCTRGPCPFILQQAWALFICVSGSQCAQIRTSPCSHLSPWGRIPSALTDCLLEDSEQSLPKH